MSASANNSVMSHQPHRAVSVEIPGRKGNGAPSPPEALAIKPSVISGNRTQMRRRPFRKIEEHLVDITTAPPFRWIIGFDDRALGRRPIGVFAEPCAPLFCVLIHHARVLRAKQLTRSDCRTSAIQSSI